MEKKDKPKYEILKNPTTGKIKKQKIDYEEWDENYPDEIDESSLGDYRKHIVRTLPCPFRFDNPTVYKEVKKPLKKAKLTCEVAVEISLEADIQAEHKHEVILDVDKTQFPLDADLTEFEYDIGNWFCGFSYKVTPKVQVTLTKKELVEDNAVKEYIAQLEKNAEKSVEKDEIESGKLKLKNYQKLFNQMKEYFEKHLAEELERVAKKLALELHTLNDRSEEREATISVLLNEEDTELRKRLITAKGRVPIKQRADFEAEKAKFIKVCLTSLKRIEARGNRLNRNQLAKFLFSDDNPLQTLRRRLKNLDVSFEELLQIYREQKSS